MKKAGRIKNNQNKVKFGLGWKIVIAGTLLLLTSNIITTIRTGNYVENILLRMIDTEAKVLLDTIVEKEKEETANLEKIMPYLNMNYIRLAKAVSEMISLDPGLLDPERIEGLSKSVGVDEIHVSDENGILLWGTVPDFFGFDFSSSDQSKSFMKAITDKGFMLAQEPTHRGIDNVLFQYIGAARMDKPGIVQIGLEPREFQQLMEKRNARDYIKNLELDNGGYACVTDLNGILASHIKPENIGTDISDTEWGKTLLELENGDLYTSIDGEEVYLRFQKYGSEIFYIVFPMNYYLMIQEDIIMKNWITNIIILCAAVIILYLFTSFYIRRPIQETDSMLKVFSHGGGDLTAALNVRTGDEIGSMAFNFNLFVGKLREIMMQIKSISDETLNRENDLAAASSQTFSALSEINSSIDSMKDRVKKLNLSIGSTDDSTGKIVNSLADFENRMSDQASMVEETSASITEMIASLENVSKITRTKEEAADSLINITAEGGKELEKTKIVFNEKVVKKVSIISEFSELISDIAARINLLSMNAAIEAAHAGNAGRGFAVVADEIRRLAKTTSGSSSKINNAVKDVLNGIKEADSSVNRTSDVFFEINKVVEQFADALKEISSNTDELSIGGKEILTATTTLSDITVNMRETVFRIGEESREVSGLMEQATEASGDVGNGMNDVARVSGEINQAMKSVTEVSAAFGKNAETLNTEINKFKV